MKLLALALFFVTPFAFGKECVVYGISDGPQKLDCSFKSERVLLRCREGSYYLNNEKVNNAFHMEVEEGPVPLVFKSPVTTLTIVIQSKHDIMAELEKNNQVLEGSCR